MDAARLLYFKMYDPEGVEDFEQKLRSSCNYLQRLKSLYEEIMALSQEELHLRVKQSWNGRTSSLQTAELDLFTSQWVRPCLDCEPGVSMKHQHLKGLLAYMASETSSTSADLQVVQAVVTGQLKRHPAVQGVLAACVEKIRMWNNGCSTMRNRHRF